MSVKITVIGAGYVGLTSAVLFALAGYKTYLIELNPDRLNAIKSGRSWFSEQGMNSLLQEALRRQMLEVVSSYEVAIPASDLVFSCVGTPDLPDGNSDLRQVFSAVEQTARYTSNRMLFVQKSTVPVGTGQDVEKIFVGAGLDVLVLSNPEFLREGTAIYDSLFPERVVVGGEAKHCINEVFGVYQSLERERLEIADIAGVVPPKRPRQAHYLAMNRNSAELVKVAANAFLAMKISFANFIAVLADAGGADARTVLKAIGLDSRIGTAFLRPSLGWAGGCFPKDVKALINRSKHHGVVPDMLEATQGMNNRMRNHVQAKIEAARAGSLENVRIAILGLSFKEGTSDVRESAAIKFAYQLADAGADVRVYDPEAINEANMIHDRIYVAESIVDSCRDAEVIVVAVRWLQFLNFGLSEYAYLASNNAIFVDAVDAFDAMEVEAVGMKYIGIGR